MQNNRLISVQPTKDIPKHVRDQAAKWFSLIDGGTATDAELKEFKDWQSADPIHEHAYDRTITLWSALGTLKADNVGEEIPSENKTRPNSAHEKDNILTFPQPPFTIRAHLPAIAAAVAICIASFTTLIFLTRPNPFDVATTAVESTYSSELGETKSVTLTDGTKITLGALSTITVEVSSTKRSVELEQGAAVFDVTKDLDRPFVVQAHDFSARVLGTVFDVRSNGGVVRLSVLEGKVLAAHPVAIGDSGIYLVEREEVTAGQRLSAMSSQGLSDVDSFSVDSFAAWREDRLKYTNATLRELIADANRYSETRIVLGDGAEDLEAMTVTVSFVGSDIDKVLASLPAIFPVTVDRTDANKIVIRAN